MPSGVAAATGEAFSRELVRYLGCLSQLLAAGRGESGRHK